MARPPASSKGPNAINTAAVIAAIAAAPVIAVIAIIAIIESLEAIEGNPGITPTSIGHERETGNLWRFVSRGVLDHESCVGLKDH
ncbi:MAG: hypothetical protein NVS3B20_21690 [Polyangiales bacterium]